MAEIILLLVSSDFIASEYCYGIKLMREIARHHVNGNVLELLFAFRRGNPLHCPYQMPTTHLKHYHSDYILTIK